MGAFILFLLFLFLFQQHMQSTAEAMQQLLLKAATARHILILYTGAGLLLRLKLIHC